MKCIGDRMFNPKPYPWHTPLRIITPFFDPSDSLVPWQRS